MARSLIRGYSQIMAETIKDAQIATDAAIKTSKLEDNLNFAFLDGSRAFTADVDMGGNKVTNAAAGTNGTDLVTKDQLDAVSAGLDPKESVRVATTAADGNIDLATGGLLTIDGEVTVAGDRVLVKNQTNATENGIYVADASAWVRSEDMDGSPASEISGGNFTFVEQGTVNFGAGFTLVWDGIVGLGTDPINWTQYSGAGQITAGDGLDKAGNVLSVNAGVGTEIVADAIDVKLDGGTLSKSASGVKLADLPSGQILVGNGSNVATGVAMSGDVLIDATGSTTLQASTVSDANVASDAAIATTKLADGAEFLQRDGSVVWTGAQDAGGLKLTNLADGTVATDAATKGQMDTADAAHTAAIDTIEASAGLSTAGAYQVHTTSNYLTAAHFTAASKTADLNNADFLLDAQIKQVADDLAALGSGSLTAVQAEVDAIETSLGSMIATDGTYVGFSGTNYLDSATDVKGALAALDTQVNTNQVATSQEVTDRTNADAAIQTELDATQTGAGLGTDGSYSAFSGSNFLDSAINLYDGLAKLDTNVQAALDAKLDDSQLIDDDTMATATATNIASAESVKAYVDSQIAGEAVGFVDDEVPTGAIDGVNTAFTVAGTPNPVSSVKVFVNGQRLRSGAGNDFTVTGSAITMLFAPEAGDQIWVDYRI